jgi:hypothetical protein
MLIVVIILTMIGPEERKVDHIKEHAEMGEENGSDFTEGKVDSHGHAEGQADDHMEILEEGRTHSQYTLKKEGIGKMNHPEKTIE